MVATFSRHRRQKKPLVRDPGMNHGTCVTHVPWCMSGFLTHGDGENVPGIPGACATRNFTYLTSGPWPQFNVFLHHFLWEEWKNTIMLDELISQNKYINKLCFKHTMVYHWLDIPLYIMIFIEGYLFSALHGGFGKTGYFSQGVNTLESVPYS